MQPKMFDRMYVARVALIITAAILVVLYTLFRSDDPLGITLVPILLLFLAGPLFLYLFGLGFLSSAIVQAKTTLKSFMFALLLAIIGVVSSILISPHFIYPNVIILYFKETWITQLILIAVLLGIYALVRHIEAGKLFVILIVLGFLIPAINAVIFYTTQQGDDVLWISQGYDPQEQRNLHEARHNASRLERASNAQDVTLCERDYDCVRNYAFFNNNPDACNALATFFDSRTEDVKRCLQDVKFSIRTTDT